jgi:hypothetical protein
VEAVARICQGRLKNRPVWRSKTRPFELVLNIPN